MCTNKGHRNAAVLPEPVFAMPIQSRPESLKRIQKTVKFMYKKNKLTYKAGMAWD